MAYRKKVLIVDDDTSLTYSLEKGLRSMSAAYEIIVANSGPECLERIKINKPDIIVLDIIMPDMDGWDVVEKLHNKKEWAKIPIIFLTGKNDNLTKTIASMSIEDFLVKPVKVEVLDQTIKKILRMPQ